MDIAKLKDVFEPCKLANDAVLIEGIHGIGKSEIVKEWCLENNYHLEELFLSHQEVGDLIGNLKTVELDGEYITYWTKPIWLQRLEKANKEGKFTVLFLDELNRAPIEVRQAALQLVLDRKIHQHSLPNLEEQKTMIIAAINPSEIYQSDDLDPALLDRFTYFKVEPNVKSWIKYAISNNLNEVIVSYIKENPKNLHNMNLNTDEKIFATPRSWTMLSKLLKNIRNLPEDIQYNIIYGRIGVLASEFFVYLNNFKNNVSIEDIENISIKAWKKTKDIEITSGFIKELIEGLEPIKKIDFFNLLQEKYLSTSASTEDSIPLLSFLYSLELEILATVLKDLANKDKEKYKILSSIDINRNLFRKLV